MTYSDKLKSPKWQKKRLSILNRDEFTCTICGNTEKTLHVHHRFYLPQTEPWDYDDKSLVTLCEICHEYETELSKTMPFELLKVFNRAGILNNDLKWILENGVNKATNMHSEIFGSVLNFFLNNHDAQNLIFDMYWNAISKAHKEDGI